jgi:prepilin peptidase CpaA
MTVLPFLLGAAAIEEDLRRRHVPNWIPATGIVLALAGAARGGGHALALSAAGMALGFLILFPFHWRGAMGGGDVKLMAACGALLGPSGILLAALFASVLGALLAAAVLVFRRSARAVPYAPAIVLGAWIALLGGA